MVFVSHPVRGVAAALIHLSLHGVSMAQSSTPGLSFERALVVAVTQAPQLDARRASVEGFSSAQLNAGQLPDPRLAVGIENLPLTGPDRYSTTRDFMTMKRIGVAQEVPNAAKRQARGDAAEARTARERAALEVERLAVQRETALAWLARHFAERRLAGLNALERENTLLQDSIAARIAAGKALPADALLVRQEALALADRRGELTLEVAKAQAALKRWVGPAAEAPLLGEAPLLLPDPHQTLDTVERHAELAGFAPMTAIAEAEVRELEAAKKGDWGWEVSYAKRGPAYSDMVSVQFSFELPLWAGQRQDPQIATKRKELERIAAEREDLRRRNVEEVEARLAEHDELNRKLGRLTDAALPLAAQRVELLLASYSAGRADLGMVLAARRDSAELQLRALELQAQRMSLRARLAYLITEARP